MRVAGDAIPRWRTRATWAAGHSAGDQMMCVYIIMMIMCIYIYMVGGLDHLLCFHILTYNNVSEGLKRPTRYILRADPGDQIGHTQQRSTKGYFCRFIGKPMIRL